MRRRQRLVRQQRRFVDMRKRPHRRSVDDQPVSGNDLWPQIVVKEVPPCRIARNDRIGDSRLRERILHSLRSSAGAQHQRRFGKIVAEQKLTAMMVTHNMKDAIAMGNRLIMMNAGRIVVDVRGEEKKKLTREDLMQLFEKAAGQEIENDRMLLS